jgi:hypothetical protein
VKALRGVLVLAVTLGILAAGRAAERTLSPSTLVRKAAVPSVAFRPAPLSPGDDLREAYGVRLNTLRMDLARFASRLPVPRVLENANEKEILIAHPDGSGGSIYWRSQAPLIPLPPGSAARDFPGQDPGGIRPPNARRLFSALSDRTDGLSAALYEASPGAARALGARLATEGWRAWDLGDALALWMREGETLLLDAPGPGRPGISLVYWRLSTGGT